jgi:hypothetical protein
MHHTVAFGWSAFCTACVVAWLLAQTCSGCEAVSCVRVIHCALAALTPPPHENVSSCNVLPFFYACSLFLCYKQGLPQWSTTMDSWGSSLLSAVSTVSTMAALGFGLPPDAFSKLLSGGPHLLAPTGSDLDKHGAVGTVLAGFHYDLNFITVRGDKHLLWFMWGFGWGGGFVA